MPDALPVITIDGPSGSGKGTVTQRVAAQLGWRVLDSGALYRLVGFAVDQRAIGFEDENKISKIAEELDVEFKDGKIFLDGREVTDLIRTEGAGNNASKVAAMPGVRAALLDWQRGYAQPRASWPMVAIWAPRFFPPPGSRFFSPRVPPNVRKGAISS